jgi:PAS domain S-box-containing protein
MTWVWVIIFAAVLLSFAMAWVKERQNQIFAHFTEERTQLNEARVNLAKGYLHISLAGPPLSPFDRMQGLALLDQAGVQLERSLRLQQEFAVINSRRQPEEDLRSQLASYAQAVSAFRSLLASEKSDLESPARTAGMRIAFFALELQAAEVELQIQRDLSMARLRYEKFQAMILWGAAGLVLVIVVAVFGSGCAQKRSEAVLRAREERHGAILKTAMDGFWLLDTQGRLLQVNDAYCRMSGYSEPELLSMGILDLDAAESPDETKAHIQKILDLGEDRFETKHRRKDGSVFDVEISVQCRSDEGGYQVVFVRDITESKQALSALSESERRLSTLIENLPGVAYRCKVDPDWTMLFISEGIFALTGYKPADLVENRKLTYADLIHPGDRESVWKAIEMAILESHHFVLEYRIITSRGEEKWVWERGRGIVDASSGKIEILEGFITDVSERKKAELALQEESTRRRILFEQSPDGIVIIDPATARILEFNEVAHRQLGYSREEFARLSISEHQRRPRHGGEWRHFKH